MKSSSIAGSWPLLVVVLIFASTTGCSTAPRAEDRATLASDARSAKSWFESNVPGLREQIDSSAGYVAFPAVGQWGVLVTGGQFGRGILNRPNDTQVGWAAINTGSLGLQAGVRGFKMLVVFEDEVTLRRFVNNQLSGSVAGVAVVGESGTSAQTSFTNGVAVYQGDSTGLMAGVNIGLDVMRFAPIERGG